MGKEKRVLLKDVANSVGVSTTLVSIVLNGKAKQYRIADEMVEKVIKVAMEMNYSPNLIARNLRGGKTQLIGLIVTDISNPFYSSIARIVENRAIELGYTVIFSSSDEDLNNTKRLIDVLLNKGVDGLIVVPCDGSEDLIQSIHENNTPLVLIDRNFPGSDLSFSCLNNYKATELTTQHLIDQGYENIALVGYKTGMNHILDRIRGYEETMQAAGLGKYIQVKKVNLLNTNVEMTNALDALVNKKKVEAVIFLTNMLAVTGLYCLKEMHISIPDDIAVIGFNRNDVFNLFSSTITHIRQPLELIATQAVNILVDKMNHGELEIKSLSFSEPQLIIGDSTPKKITI
ncbi:MAG: LacI family DNA-binding transcriptional regulator [Paludibacter sp.]|nr:LacI family DNA-binding transcriptional regulator [Paludibacter sp.]